ncbi:MAG: DmsE family decaheme c-type cytochrome [Gammaproteobacteria bacterium]|nr:DmsE family decaheme c-type cytochrome [Gammaproteobacteria bacterium]
MNTAERSGYCLFFKLAIALFAYGFLGHAAFAETAPGGEMSSKDVVLRGDADCIKCHDEDQAYPVLRIGKTRHGVMADNRTPTCTSCHGESKEHMRKGSDEDRPRPDITYGDMNNAVPRMERVNNEIKYPVSPASERNATCLTCHEGGKRMFWDGSTHSNRDVACNNCHQVHTGNDRVKDKETQTELCFSCHKEQRAQFNKPSHHPVPEGEMGCSDCHNPHGSAGTSQLVKDSVNETCFQCHMEKRGPFVHNHQPVTEDCTICHNPHGTAIATLLKTRPPFLCQQCHSHTSHPTQNAALPDDRFTSSRGLGSVGRGCLNCHTNIHGGNSIMNRGTAGRFRR